MASLVHAPCFLSEDPWPNDRGWHHSSHCSKARKCLPPFLRWCVLWVRLCRSREDSFVRLDQDVFSPYAGKKKLYAYESPDFWEQIKNPG